VPLDLTNVDRLLEAYVQTDGDTGGAEVFFWAEGSVYAWIPGVGGYHLFDEQLFAVRRFKRLARGWLRLHKEAGVYLDKDTGKLLERWRNPFTGREVEVFQLKNDPVNREHLPEQQGTVWGMEHWENGDTVCFYRNVFVAREADMKVAQYPLQAQGDLHEFGELYNFFASRKALEQPGATSVPMVGCNSRIGQWLPWMEMGQQRGYLMVQLRFKKVAGVGDLHPLMRDYWMKQDPSIFVAPEAITGPNDTSWSYYRKVVDQRRREQAVRGEPVK